MKCLVSILVHQLNAEQLRSCLYALADSAAQACQQDALSECRVILIYNGTLPVSDIQAQMSALLPDNLSISLRCGLDNQGYGAGQNLALFDAWGDGCDWWLAMNPDVLCAPDTLSRAFRYLGTRDAVLLAPRVLSWDGSAEQHLCRRYPSLLMLLARQFAQLRRISGIEAEHARYLYLDRDGAGAWTDADVCSGCFMLLPLPAARRLGGFDNGFFLYFEDYDLSRRALASGLEIHYRPEVLIRHAGGAASQKGWNHRRWFVRSAVRFFARHGWRFWRVGKPAGEVSQ